MTAGARVTIWLHQGRTRRLRAPIGRQADAPLSVDIRTDGPHALVAGTTGAGKSELLQSYVASLAATHSPRHMTFLLVDYKGGAAFKDCVHLPHAVGLVTDLNTSEVRRALVSLDAELRYRETVLNEAGAKDLIELERVEHPKTPPTLMVIVDEFAALAKEVPEFIDGVVDVALRAAPSAFTFCSPRSDRLAWSLLRSGPTPACGSHFEWLMTMTAST